MGKALRNHEVPSLAAENTTWQQLVRHAPPHVVTQALGHSPTTALDYAERAGAHWMRYAADRPSDRQ